MNIDRRSVIKGVGAGGLAGGLLAGSWVANAPSASAAGDDPVQNILSAAVAWRVTAAERDMLHRQGFNIARERLDAALERRRKKRHRRGRRKPLAFISDIDDTVLSTDPYWKLLIEARKQALDDPLWDEWIAGNGPTATPGAVAFTQYAKRKGVQIFYVSNRDQGENTQKYGVANLRKVGMAFADDAHVTMQRDTSNKEPAQQAIAARYEIIAYLGDNLNDFSRRYYVTGVEERRRLATQDADTYGHSRILFPNNTDGHWMRAIFGDSEPLDTPEYRARMLAAAKGLVP